MVAFHAWRLALVPKLCHNRPDPPPCKVHRQRQSDRATANHKNLRLNPIRHVAYLSYWAILILPARATAFQRSRSAAMMREKSADELPTGSILSALRRETTSGSRAMRMNSASSLATMSGGRGHRHENAAPQHGLHVGAGFLHGRHIGQAFRPRRRRRTASARTGAAVDLADHRPGIGDGCGHLTGR